MHILIAEDDPTLQALLQTYLEHWGYQVTAVDNGKAAWEILTSENRPKIALLDWIMPDLTGVEIATKLAEQKHANPTYVIILTALDSKDKIVEGLEAGANDYVIKPFDPNELQARISVGRKVVELQDALSKRVAELQDALKHVKTLQGIIPICSHCHNIRNDEESWQRIEAYFCEHSDVQFSHGICPECMKIHYADLFEDDPESDEPVIT